MSITSKDNNKQIVLNKLKTVQSTTFKKIPTIRASSSKYTESNTAPIKSPINIKNNYCNYQSDESEKEVVKINDSENVDNSLNDLQNFSSNEQKNNFYCVSQMGQKKINDIITSSHKIVEYNHNANKKQFREIYMEWKNTKKEKKQSIKKERKLSRKMSRIRPIKYKKYTQE